MSVFNTVLRQLQARGASAGASPLGISPTQASACTGPLPEEDGGLTLAPSAAEGKLPDLGWPINSEELAPGSGARASARFAAQHAPQPFAPLSEQDAAAQANLRAAMAVAQSPVAGAAVGYLHISDATPGERRKLLFWSLAAVAAAAVAYLSVGSSMPQVLASWMPSPAPAVRAPKPVALSGPSVNPAPLAQAGSEPSPPVAAATAATVATTATAASKPSAPAAPAAAPTPTTTPAATAAPAAPRPAPALQARSMATASAVLGAAAAAAVAAPAQAAIAPYGHGSSPAAEPQKRSNQGSGHREPALLGEAAPPTPARVNLTAKPASPQVAVQLAWNEAVQAAQAGQRQAALGKARSVLALEPTHSQARLLAATLELEAGAADKANTLLTEGLALAPADENLALALARTQAAQGLADEAWATLDRSALRSAEAQGLRGGILARRGEFAAALATYEAAARAQPGNGLWWMGMGVSLESLGEPSQARLAFARADSLGLPRENLANYVRERLMALP